MKYIIHSIIKNIDIKKKILEKLYAFVNFQKIKYIILKFDDQLDELVKNSDDIYITYQLNSTNNLLFFIFLDSKKYSLLIRREKITKGFEKAKSEIDLIEICEIILPEHHMLSQLYNGSIFETKLAKDKSYNKLSIIDIYYFLGENMLDKTLSEKLKNYQVFMNKIDDALPRISIKKHINYINPFIDISHYENDLTTKIMTNINFNEFLKILYDEKYNTNVCDIDVSTYIKKNELVNYIDKVLMNGYNVNGLIFMPNISGIFYVFSNNENFNDRRKKINKS